MGLFTRLKQGQKYSDTWPLQPKLSPIFPENRIIKAVKFAQKTTPAIAVMSLVWQQLMTPSQISALSIAIITALFALSLPIQGIYWLGWRSCQTLPKITATHYQTIFAKVNQKQTLTKVEKPTYMDLAILLKLAKQHLGNAFWDEL